WIEVHTVTSATSKVTTDKMRETFSTHGLPEILVTDNGTVFTSVEFETFLSRNGIRHITSAPYHPATNGLAERAVQTFKTAIKKADPTVPIETTIARFLPINPALDHRNFAGRVATGPTAPFAPRPAPSRPV
ncbi:MAG: hypothetical protein ETSY2_42860, partial [Candidatus Entotheonella gemina]